MRMIFYLQKFLFFFKQQCYPLQNSSLGQLHNDGDVVSSFGSIAGGVLIFLTESPMSKISLVVWSQVMNHGFFNTIKRLSKERHTVSSPRPKKARMSKSKIKSMLILFFDRRGIVHTEFVPQKTSFPDFSKHPKESNGHAEDHTGWRLPALLPKVGTTSPSVCSCPRQLFWRG